MNNGYMKRKKKNVRKGKDKLQEKKKGKKGR